MPTSHRFRRHVLTGAICLVAAVALTDAAAAQDARGQALFKARCGLCHTTDNLPRSFKQVPDLAGIFGRAAGRDADFRYTPQLLKSGLIWNKATLQRYLANPAGVVPGTSMPVKVAKPEDRDAIIAYLAQLKPSR